MKTKKIWGGLVSLVAAALLAEPLVLVKSYAAPVPQAAGKEGMKDKLQAAVDSLNLNDDQKERVKGIFAEAKTKRQAVMNDNSLSDDEKKAKMKELHGDTMGKLNEVLTPEQQTELKSKMEAAKAKQQAPQP
jgi:Spy/CpxP family protein refolding chaperone